MTSANALHTIDIASLFDRRDETARPGVPRPIPADCRSTRFIYLAGPRIAPEFFAALDRASCRFFALPESTKADIAMAKGGLAWRGWFPVGGELTSGQPDLKEGLYLGTELAADDP